MRKSQSNEMPLRLKVTGKEIYITNNVEEITKHDEMMDEDITYYEYDYISLKGYSEEFVDKHFADIFANPDKYNVLQHNNKYYEGKGEAFAAMQEVSTKQVEELGEAVDMLILDGLVM
jgi:hypothetical protein